jgi:hypothetical protein
MSNSDSSLIQTLIPERWAGWSMDFIGAGYMGLLIKNGQLVRKLEPGRHFSFAIPWIEQAQILLVDTKIRNLDVVSHGDFLSRDQYLVNVSLSVMYQVIDPKRVAIELSDAIAALTSAVKDNLGVVINQLRLDELTQEGRVRIREYLLSHLDSFYLLGFNLEDVRVSDISFPQGRGVVRQVEGMSARQEAEHEARLKMQIANAEQRTLPFQQIHINTNSPTTSETPSLPQTPVKPTFVIPGDAAPVKLPAAPLTSALPPTTLVSPAQVDQTMARLVHRGSGAIAPLSANPFTIGREPHHHFVSESPLCSRNHARIEMAQDDQGKIRYQLVDLGSSNGTFLNNQRLIPNYPYLLKTGCIIKIGSDEWVFEA